MTKKEVDFQFFNPYANYVGLAGTFNNWDPKATPMKKDWRGTWKTTLSLKPGRYEYRLYVDGNWTNDPNCNACVPNSFGTKNCVKEIK